MFTLRWMDPIFDTAQDDPDWAVWETRCGTYRITYSADSDTYRPAALKINKLGRDTTERAYLPVACDQPSLDQAFAAVNEYHCSKHNLVLVQ